MFTHSIDDLLPHAPLHYAATGEMVKGSYYNSADHTSKGWIDEELMITNTLIDRLSRLQ